MQVPPLSKFYEAVEAGRIMMDTDPTDRLVCFRYTEETAAHADWDSPDSAGSQPSNAQDDPYQKDHVIRRLAIL